MVVVRFMSVNWLYCYVAQWLGCAACIVALLYCTLLLHATIQQ